MVAQRDAGKMKLIPIKLYKDDGFDVPTWMRDEQYMHPYHYSDIASMVEKIVESLDRALQGTD